MRCITVDVNAQLKPPPPDSCKPTVLEHMRFERKTAPSTPLFIFVSVKDSGPGLEPEDLSLLFKRFDTAFTPNILIELLSRFQQGNVRTSSPFALLALC